MFKWHDGNPQDALSAVCPGFAHGQLGVQAERGAGSLGCRQSGVPAQPAVQLKFHGPCLQAMFFLSLLSPGRVSSPGTFTRSGGLLPGKGLFWTASVLAG